MTIKTVGLTPNYLSITSSRCPRPVQRSSVSEMANGKNTMEYGKILHISPKLCDVVADGNVITLSRKMFEAGLISNSNAGKTLRNVMVDSKMRRAAELVH